MALHELKCWPIPFAAVSSGAKTFEFRKNDRNFRMGDTLLLREWIPSACRNRDGEYTGGQLRFRVTYLLAGPSFGVPTGYCVMSIAEVSP